ncbi:hypothetical protein JOB18_014190 [Solea senegalensis]|uniref:Dynein attachment factor N-terminal domain-containing protein n=1 Tax=Solea senegalensis TaxID=28829 RepID=A0AAV6R9N4_SOLSE|nr:hypothetical protein JOB18_014190 [Solea senegalensis]
MLLHMMSKAFDDIISFKGTPQKHIIAKGLKDVYRLKDREEASHITNANYNKTPTSDQLKSHLPYLSTRDLVFARKIEITDKVAMNDKSIQNTVGRSEADVIDFPALERELQVAVESERRYLRENEAKLRAITQRVASYKEFRDLVLACHMKPLEKIDKDRGPQQKSWNPVVPGNQ